MAQYIYTMNKVSKIVPPKREILKDISLSFFPVQKSVCWVSTVPVNQPYLKSWQA